jgi:hypothetical protein
MKWRARASHEEAAMANATTTVAAAFAALTLGATGRAFADPPVDYFISPSGNIACMLGDGLNGGVACDISEHTYAVPPPPANCPLSWGDRFELKPGQPPIMTCHGDTVRNPGNERTLGYGQTVSMGPITCASEAAGMTCTDSGTGHFFRVARDSYDMQ